MLLVLVIVTFCQSCSPWLREVCGCRLMATTSFPVLLWAFPRGETGYISRGPAVVSVSVRMVCLLQRVTASTTKPRLA